MACPEQLPVTPPPSLLLITADPVIAKLYSKRLITLTECWEYTGKKNEHGYGKFQHKGKHWFVHRFIKAYVEGRDLVAGEVVLHKCDNPACFNPEHLALGSILSNVQDMDGKKRRNTSPRRQRLNEQLVRRIKMQLAYTQSAVSLATQFNCDRRTICDIKNGVTWRHVKLDAHPIFAFDPFE